MRYKRIIVRVTQMDTLPSDIIRLICARIELSDIVNLSTINSKLYSLCDEDVWHDYCHRYYLHKEGFVKLGSWLTAVRRYNSGRWINLSVCGNNDIYIISKQSLKFY